MLQEERNEKFQEKSKDYQKRKKRLRAAFIKMSLMAMLLIVSTYAWFTSQKDISLTNLRGTVEVAENMEISLDAKTWHQEIDLSDVSVFNVAQASRDSALGENASTRTTALALLPTELLPVSAIGEKDGSDMPLYGGKATSTKLTDIVKKVEIDATTKKANDNGYFAFDIYIKNTSKDGEDDVLQLNINSAAQVLTQSITKIMENTVSGIRIYQGDEASGLQNTIRVGLALYGSTASSTATQKEILEATKAATVSDIAIWEPNAYDHVEYIVSNNNKLINGTGDTTGISFDDGEDVKTYALKSSAVTAGIIENVYDITSEGLGVQNTFKTDNNKNESTGKIVDYKIKTTDSKPIDIKNISNADFKITSNTVSRLRVYVWLEGQDVDCINLASQGGGIELDLGLTKDDEIGDGTQSIATLQSNHEFKYYSTLSGAVADVNNDTIGTNTDATMANAVAGIYETEQGETSIVLLKDATETSSITMKKDVILNLGGNTLTFNNVSIGIQGDPASMEKITIDGRIAGSGITMKNDAILARMILIQNGIKLVMNGGTYATYSITNQAIAVVSQGNVEINDCNIYVDSENSHSRGVFNYGGIAKISNSTIFADSPYLRGEDGSVASSSCGIESQNISGVIGTITISNCNITGTHAAINNCGNLYVDGGTYQSIGHAAFALTSDGTSTPEIYISNATLMDGTYNGKYDVTKMANTSGHGLLIGGSSNAHDITVHMNNCIISGKIEPIYMRGSSGETNNVLYISNSNINLDKKIRIYNDTLKLYIGKNCNFNADNTTLPSSVTITDEEYTQ